MLVALTGASGFVGSYTAHALKARGHRVRALVRASSRRDHIADAVSEWVDGEQQDAAAHRKLVDGVDAVIHNAVDFGAARSMAENLETNVRGSLMLLDATRAAGVKQFIFVSSVGALTRISPEWGGQVDELHPLWPGSLYGAYKAAVEAFCWAYQQQHGMNTSAWRPAAIYGVDPKRERSQWHDLIGKVKAGEPVDTAGGGKITHVQDVADALALALGDETVSGQAFNLIDRHLYWQDVAEIAKQVTGSSSIIENIKGTGPKNQFDCRMAIEFFNRHGNTVALRRGTEGVREYVGQLLKA
ncbi:MAG TPA: NAD(P)-dependent oxidoreductase [Tepidisphaeraceae bacterium]|jgi:nucleoside-diphosphate-sugar epimerase